MRLADKDIAIEGSFELPQLARLASDDQVFITAFVRSHGSIKEMEQVFGVSYPTIKARLTRIADSLEFVETNPTPSRTEVLDRLKTRRDYGARSHPRTGVTVMIPMVGVVSVRHWRRSRDFRLWIPLFLLWLLLLPFAVLALPVLLHRLSYQPGEPVRSDRNLLAHLRCAERHTHRSRQSQRACPDPDSVGGTMNDHRRQILEMLSAGKITADEAERLIAALEREVPGTPSGNGSQSTVSKAKYLRVLVDSENGGNPIMGR